VEEKREKKRRIRKKKRNYKTYFDEKLANDEHLEGNFEARL
jgi:hypothetical protein